MRELQGQLEGNQDPDLFPVPCAHNVFLHESKRSQTGYCAEEEKMQSETQKILEDPGVGVSARCVRVPVFRAHSIALNIELENSFEIHELRKTIESAPGVAYRDDVTALDATGQKSVFCGNLRTDPTRENTFELWICGDQLLKGAALNLYQLAITQCLI
jgi:aspartate-semialdehyde dehydrogenase